MLAMKLRIHQYTLWVYDFIYLDIEYYCEREKMGQIMLAHRSPKIETEATRVWLILSRAGRAVEQNAMASISGLGLGLSDFAVLELLLHKGPQPVSVIGKKVLLSS